MRPRNVVGLFSKKKDIAINNIGKYKQENKAKGDGANKHTSNLYSAPKSTTDTFGPSAHTG